MNVCPITYSYPHPENSDWRVLACTVVVQGYAIPAGFVWDGASIPRAFWSIIGHPHEGGFTNASLLHDWLYVTHLVDRERADYLFHTQLRKDGNSATKSWLMLRAVRLAGGPAYRRKRRAEDNFFPPQDFKTWT